MQRIGRVLRLRKGTEAEYERYHADVWPEVLEAIRKSGIRNHTIFRYGRWLFSYFELPDNVSLTEAGRIISSCDACRRWEELMHALQEPLSESERENWWVLMKEVFHANG